MPTFMDVYAEIASRYGVILQTLMRLKPFSEKGVYKLPQLEQEKIAIELLDRDGELPSGPTPTIKVDDAPFPDPNNYVRADTKTKL